jgi:hypothetical protein
MNHVNVTGNSVFIIFKINASRTSDLKGCVTFEA